MRLATFVAALFVTILVSCGGEPPPPPAPTTPTTNAETAPPEPVQPAAKVEPSVQKPPPPPMTTQYAYGLNRSLEAGCLDDPLAFSGTLARVFTVEPSIDGSYTVTIRFVPDTLVARIPDSVGVYEAQEAAPVKLVMKADVPTKTEVFYPIVSDGEPVKLGLKETVTVVVKASDGLPYSVLADGSPGLDQNGVKLVCGSK